MPAHHRDDAIELVLGPETLCFSRGGEGKCRESGYQSEGIAHEGIAHEGIAAFEGIAAQTHDHALVFAGRS
jgi:hypothetical protein